MLEMAEVSSRDVVMDLGSGDGRTVIAAARDRFDTPIAAYNVSGEYSMLKAASANEWIEERTAAMEMLTSIKRAGADILITYFAKDAAVWLADET